jgi:hypothetical protein
MPKSFDLNIFNMDAIETDSQGPGLIFRLVGRDPLQLKIDRRAATYWQAKKPSRGVRSFFQRLSLATAEILQFA